MPAPRTLRRVVVKEAIALLALPSHPLPGLSPCSSKLVKLLFHLGLAVRLSSISWIPIGPLIELGRLTWTFRTTDMLALIADVCRCGVEKFLAYVAGTADALPCGLVYQFVSASRSDGEHSLSFRLFHALLFSLLLLGRLLLRVSRTFLASLVLALQAHLVSAVKSSATMATTVDTHTDRLLHSLHGRLGSWRGDPLVRF